jgi:hypothetical protein
MPIEAEINYERALVSVEAGHSFTLILFETNIRRLNVIRTEIKPCSACTIQR